MFAKVNEHIPSRQIPLLLLHDWKGHHDREHRGYSLASQLLLLLPTPSYKREFMPSSSNDWQAPVVVDGEMVRGSIPSINV
jgi:hypothetical protein